MLFAPLFFAILKAEAFALFATSRISECITLLAVGRISGIITDYSNWYFPVTAVGEGQRSAFSLE